MDLMGRGLLCDHGASTDPHWHMPSAVGGSRKRARPLSACLLWHCNAVLTWEVMRVGESGVGGGVTARQRGTAGMQ